MVYNIAYMYQCLRYKPHCLIDTSVVKRFSVYCKDTIQSMWAVIVFITFTKKTLVFSPWDIKECFQVFLHSWVTLPWQRRWDNFCQAPPSQSHLWWLALRCHPSRRCWRGLCGWAGRGQGRNLGWRDRKREGGSKGWRVGSLALWAPANNGCQRCTQVKLKWLQCEGKESDPSGGQECAMQEGHSHASQDLFKTLTDRVAVWLTSFGKMEINEKCYHFIVIHTSADQWAASLTNSGHPVVT